MSKPSETETEAVVFDPATGTVRSRHAWMSPEEVDRASARARGAQARWSELTPRQRARRIRPLAHWLSTEAEGLSSVICQCTGKPRMDAVTYEVLPAAIATRHYCRMAPRWLAPERPTPSNVAYRIKHARIHRVPHGLVGIIAPWNYPLGIPSHEIVSALLAGNGVLFKTAPETVPVGEALAEGIAGLDLPEGLFAHLVMPGPAAGERFLGVDGVDKLNFTGSTSVGHHLAKEAAERFVPVTLELGGKDAMLVRADAPMPRAANGAVWGGMQNSGQACAGIERIYVEDAIHDRFVSAVAERVEALHVGPPGDPCSDVGPLASRRQLEHVRAQVDAAISGGARIAAQAAPGPTASPEGFYYPATLLTGVHEGMSVMREETFGPVIAVQRVRDLDEAVALANDSPYALTASIWTRDRRRARRWARRLNAGTVMLNDHLMTHGMPELPWGGPGISGLGRTHGRTGMHGMTRELSVVDDRLWFLPRQLWWFPYDAGLVGAMGGLLDLLHGRGLRRRLAGGSRALRLLPRMVRDGVHDGSRPES